MNLMQVRNKQGLTQRQLSKLAGVSQSLISKFEIGSLYPDKLEQLKIEGVLGPVDWIATKLQGFPTPTASEGEESAENRVIRAIELYANRDAEAYGFLLAYIQRRHSKTVLMDKVQRHLKGEKVSFSKAEIKLIRRAKANRPK